MILYGTVFFIPWPSHVPRTKVAAPSSTNSTTAPARGFFSLCTCTEPAGADIGAVCVERRGQTWPKKMLSHTHPHTLKDKQKQGNLISYDPFDEAFFPGKPRS